MSQSLHDPSQKMDMSTATSTESTRYLCAAAHLDGNFRNYILEHVIHEEHKAVASSYGVDLTAITRYCRAAQDRELYRDMLLCLLLIITIPLITRALLLFFLFAWIIVIIEQWNKYYGKVAAGLAKQKFHPDNLEVYLDSYLEAKLKELSNTTNNNVIVYSGYSPFVGAGQNIGGWSFVVDVSQGKKDEKGQLTTPIEFRLTELYNYLDQMLSKLGIPGLKIEDKLCVSGQEIRDDERFRSDYRTRPYMQVEDDLVQDMKEHSSQHIRYYKCIQVTSWDGELILSIFLRAAQVGKNLFLEANYLLLTPVASTYRKIDTTTASFTLRKFLSIAGATLLPTIGYWLASPFRLLARMFASIQREGKQQRELREIEENPAYDYGAVRSLREFVSSNGYHQHFQKLDKEMYLKIIENEIMDSLLQFLEDHNIDTTEFKQRQEIIQNNGVIVSGGSFQAGNLAVGERAKTAVSNIMQSARTTLGNQASSATR